MVLDEGVPVVPGALVIVVTPVVTAPVLLLTSVTEISVAGTVPLLPVVGRSPVVVVSIIGVLKQPKIANFKL